MSLQKWNDIKPGTILIYVGPDNNFINYEAECEVYQDKDGLYVINDDGREEFLTEKSIKYFAVKD